ncbi:MAG: hypothetical protein KAG99_03130, partial [Bacteroidales bacterium]|nr:hypothetical protein [Bacteroidales bacterium]
NLEYHNNVWANLPAANGNQYVEMDTHASGCGSKANVRISQELATCIGEVYAISFAWRPRLNPSNSDCKLEVYWGGDLKVTYDNTNYVGNANGGWDYETIEVTGSGLVTLSFVETGDPDQLGTFLDAILIQ